MSGKSCLPAPSGHELVAGGVVSKLNSICAGFGADPIHASDKGFVPIEIFQI